MRRLFVFLALSVLLPMQCIAPVAHAHIDGHHSHQGIHIELTGASISVDCQIASIAHANSMAIGIPVAHGPSSTSFTQPQHSAGLTPPLPLIPICGQSDSNQHSLFVCIHQLRRPFGQAPPV